ncbi:MAG: radical SAM protein [Oscillospiraceae bacterium]|nr:radical SAM protein [Oscillospiraceae bacterium]
MKNVYLIQPTNLLSDSIYLPYSIGTIAAYSWQFEEIRAQYELKELLFLKDDPEQTVKQLEEPFLFGFSCYIWNFEYNLIFAKKLKETFPDCIVAFGGPQIPEDTSYLEEYPQIDILMYGEGEETFCGILKALKNADELKTVANLAFRNGDEIVVSPKAVPGDVYNFPSPYTEGYFDKILSDERFKNVKFNTIVETNRGCPYKCLYCSWGDNDAPLRKISMERVKKDLEWSALHKIEYCMCADANFGIYERDEEIIDYIVELKKIYGYPQKFEIIAAKNKNDLIFNINKKLFSVGLNKGVDIACQTLTPEVLNNIGRKNISNEEFAAELKRYRDAGMITFTDLIIALPGETFESFCESLFGVIELGQHELLNIHTCELLPAAPMHSPDIIKKFGIKTVRSNLRQTHGKTHSDTVFGSKSEIVVETNSLSRYEWRELNRLCATVRAFHSFGLLRNIAFYLRWARNISYKDFYLRLFAFIQNENEYLSGLLNYVTATLDPFIEGKGDMYFSDERFGDIYLPFEEGLFMCAVTDSERFFAEIKIILGEFFDDKELFGDLFRYQIADVTVPFAKEHAESFLYNWPAYFADPFAPLPRYPEKIKTRVLFSPESYSDLPEYTREAVWYGKSKNRTTVQNKKLLN